MENAGSNEFSKHFLEGEGYVKSPDLVAQWLAGELPITDVAAPYVLFKPLAEVDADLETPATVVLLADPDQLSALVILANYGREGMENVAIPYAAGCQTIGILPFREARAVKPRAVVGLTDISARKYVRTLLGSSCLSFAMPWRMFLEMEGNVHGSFLEKDVWRHLTLS